MNSEDDIVDDMNDKFDEYAFELDVKLQRVAYQRNLCLSALVSGTDWISSGAEPSVAVHQMRKTITEVQKMMEEDGS